MQRSHINPQETRPPICVQYQYGTHVTAPCCGAIHPDEILPPSFWCLALSRSLGMNDCVRPGHLKVRCLPGRIQLTRSTGGRDDADLTPFHRKSPQKPSLGSTSVSAASLFLLLQVSWYIFIRFFPMSYFQPFLGFSKLVLLHHRCCQAW